jgi:spermidine/putrescine transport system ATP-binding protein
MGYAPWHEDKEAGVALTPETAEIQPVAELRSATKRFSEVLAVDALNLAIAKGEFMSFLGPSGCGKTTALRMLAGFEVPTSGEVLIDGQVVNDLPAHRRPVNMVFQHYALFPHLTVADNIAYGLRQRRPRIDARVIRDKVERALDSVRLSDFGSRRIWEMSGGQQQRVALARAIVNEPKLLLLDEPLAALDRKLRHEMQIELQNLQRALGITFVLVTHDQEEALSMSDRVCVMRGGQIVQVGTPQGLYDAPGSRYVADFVGKSNFFEGTLLGAEGALAALRSASGRILRGSNAAPEGAAPLCLSVRPEQINLTRTASDDSAIEVLIRNRIFLGEHTEYLVHSPELGDFLVLVPRRAEADQGIFVTGETAFATWDDRTALVLDAS